MGRHAGCVLVVVVCCQSSMTGRSISNGCSLIPLLKSISMRSGLTLASEATEALFTASMMCRFQFWWLCPAAMLNLSTLEINLRLRRHEHPHHFHDCLWLCVVDRDDDPGPMRCVVPPHYVCLHEWVLGRAVQVRDHHVMWQLAPLREGRAIVVQVQGCGLVPVQVLILCIEVLARQLVTWVHDRGVCREIGKVVHRTDGFGRGAEDIVQLGSGHAPQIGEIGRGYVVQERVKVRWPVVG